MAWITRLLVVANRTAGSEELTAALRARAEGADLQVTIVMPAPVGQQDDARTRLDAVLQTLREHGIDATGIIGDADPVNAALDAWNPWRFDEIMLCTLPPGESTWLHIDLPHRLRRLTDATVQHVIAQSVPRAA